MGISKKLSLTQKKKVIRLITSSLYIDTIDKVRYENIKDDIRCPHCNSASKITKHGMYKGRQRYCCRKCNKTFNELTGTCVSGLRNRHVWLRFVEMTVDCETIRDISKELELSRQTILEWRHKLLISIGSVFTKEFKDTIQIDEIEVPFNQKGRRPKNFNEPRRKYLTYTDSFGNKCRKRATDSLL